MKMMLAVAVFLISAASVNLAMDSMNHRVAVEDRESSRVRGGAVAGVCYNQGSYFYVCTRNSSCDPTVIPPVTGLSTFANLGSQTNACYKSQYGYATCPCGNVNYGPFTIAGNSSCYANPAD